MTARGYGFYLKVFNSRYRVEQEKIKFISTSGHVTFFLLYKHTKIHYLLIALEDKE